MLVTAPTGPASAALWIPLGSAPPQSPELRSSDPVPVYRRFRERGRLAPDGLRYLASWVTDDFRRCFQVMGCDDPGMLERWMANWRDLVEFEVVAVKTSAEAAAAIAPQL